MDVGDDAMAVGECDEALDEPDVRRLGNGVGAWEGLGVGMLAGKVGVP